MKVLVDNNLSPLFAQSIHVLVEPDGDEVVALRHRFPANTPDLPSLKRFFAANPEAFPDMRVELQDVIAEGDLVAYRAVVTGTHRGEFAGMKPTGRRITVTEINISRFRDGKMVEHWALLDEASMLRQLTS